MEWRFFPFGKYREARAWVREGNIAVYPNTVQYKGKETMHLMIGGLSLTQLGQVMRELGLKTEWLHHKHYQPHFDLFGIPLKKALSKCGVKP